MAEDSGLLPPGQMGNRTQRSTESALDLLTSQVRTIWGSKKHVATMLSLDIAGAFDTVNPVRLLHILRGKKIPFWLVRWVSSFLSDRTTTLVFGGSESPLFSTNKGVPQGSPLSPILFILYNHELLEICSRPKEGITACGFADDVNILTYGRSTEDNCRTIERIYARCLEWADRHGMVFAPKKFELIHFTKARSKFNLQASVRLQDIEKAPTQTVRVLGVWLDTKLLWKAHLSQILTKATTQGAVLNRLSKSTWGFTFTAARRIYTSIVRPTICYGASAWALNPRKSTIKKLNTVQAKSLRAITGAYRATPVPILEVEAYVPPIDLFLQERVQAFQARTKNTPAARHRDDLCLWIRRRTKQRPLRQEAPYPRTSLLELWKNRWNLYDIVRQQEKWKCLSSAPTYKILQLHKQLTKAESSALVQFRTGRAGLGLFLFRAQVPSYDTPACRCGATQETPFHVLFECPNEERGRPFLKDIPPNLSPIEALAFALDSPLRTKATSTWIVQLPRLKQFSLASDLLEQY